MPAHSRMLETWILCELCNVGNMQDAVMLREHSVFFEGDTPQLVRTHIYRGLKAVGCFSVCCMTCS
jgi:hypothetical protein